MSMNLLGLDRPLHVEFLADYRGHQKGAKVGLMKDAEITAAIELCKAGTLKFSDAAVQQVCEQKKATATRPGQAAQTMDAGGITPQAPAAPAKKGK